MRRFTNSMNARIVSWRLTGAVICATPLKRLSTRLSPSRVMPFNSVSSVVQNVF